MIDMRKGDYIGTYSGIHFYPLDPRPEDVKLTDIAHALANICRFNGHTKRFYSVAEHSLNVAWLLENRGCKPKTVLYGLIHDAAEAYVCDVPRPLKRSLKGYKDIERNVMMAIYQAFGIMEPAPYQKCMIDLADNYILALEARDLMLNSSGWELLETDPDDKLPIWDDVEYAFAVKLTELRHRVSKRTVLL